MGYQYLKDTTNFKISEFKCKCCNKIPDKPEVADHIKRLQAIRGYCNRIMKVNSGYRCEKYNAAVGGVKGSQHVQGIASDIAIPAEIISAGAARKDEWLRNMRTKWHELCRADGLGGGVGFYDTFIHLDSRKVQSDFDYRTKK